MRKIIMFNMLGSLVMFAPLLIAVSCSGDGENLENNGKDIKISSFNISFATDGDKDENYKRWFDYLSINIEEQNKLVNKIKAKINMTQQERALAERVVQIRNIAAIIQKNKPDVLVLNEFNNDGNGENKEIIKLFQDNYLSIGQSMNSIEDRKSVV